MSETTLPKPLAAYVGLVLASVEETRRSGGSPAAQVARFPIAAAGQLLTARSHYDELAVNGDVIADVVIGIVRQRFWSGREEAGDWIGDEFTAARGRTGGGAGASSRFERLAEEFETLVDETVTDPIQEATEKLLAPETPTVAPEPVTKAKAAKATRPRTTAPKVTPLKTVPPLKVAARRPATKAATVPTPVAPATPPTPLQKLESFSVTPEVGAAAGGLKDASDLPLKDFDHMSGPQLRGRLRTLDRVQLVQLLDYERAHANRVGIIVMLENRLTKLNAAN